MFPFVFMPSKRPALALNRHDSSTVSHISNDVYIIIIEKQKPSKNGQRRWAVHRQAVRLACSVLPVTELAQSVSQVRHRISIKPAK